ncbi:MAG: hypothetical protein U0517_03115 [Candidatus Andersenbacteria bacterium]
MNYVSELSEIGSAYTEAVAVALYARLQELPSGRKLRSLDEIMTLASEQAGIPALWARSLTGEQADALVQLALARCDILHEHLQDLQSQTLFDTAWMQDVAWLLEDRDDNECIRWVLAQSGRDAPLQRALAATDRRTRSYIASVPYCIVIRDERLRRAAVTDSLLAPIVHAGGIRFEV